MNRVLCPVCNVRFPLRDPDSDPGDTVICTVCGACLRLAAIAPEPVAERAPEPPEEEINGRIDRFAEMRGFVFDDGREIVVEGLLQKYEMFGDFYCPCRMENVDENVCPCLDTRSGSVKRDGHCLCGLFWLPDAE